MCWGARGAVCNCTLSAHLADDVFAVVEGDLRNEEGKGSLAHFSGGMFVSRQPAECGLADRYVEVCDQGRILRQVGHRSRRTNCPRDPNYGICQ